MPLSHRTLPFSAPARRLKFAPLNTMPDSSKPSALPAPLPPRSPTQAKLAQLEDAAPDLIPLVDELLDRLLVLVADTST